jgi:hypothetical protein
MWVYASTTYLSYSKPPAGEGVVKAAMALTGTILGGLLGLALVWTTNPTTGLQSMASPLYIFVLVAVLVFALLLSPKLLGMQDKFATTFATTLLSVVSWSFVRGTRQAAAAAAVTLIVGTTIGIILSFAIGSCLFPVSSTWSYLKGCNKVVDLIAGQLHHSLKLLRLNHSGLNDSEGGSSGGSGISPHDSPAVSTVSSVEEGETTESEEVKALRRGDKQLWELLQRSSKLNSLLDDSQNEAYLRLLCGGYTVVPCWPFRYNCISKSHFALVQKTSRDLAAIIVKLSNLVRLGLSPDVLADLRGKQYPVDSIPRIADLAVAAAVELRDKCPKSMRPGSARLPSDKKIIFLQREVLALMKSEAETRDRQFAVVANKEGHGRGGDVRGVLDSLDQHMMWFSFLESVKLTAGALLRLHLCLSAAIIKLPWFEDPSLSSEELRNLEQSIVDSVDALMASYGEGADEFGILESYSREKATTGISETALSSAAPSMTKTKPAPKPSGGGFGGLKPTKKYTD